MCASELVFICISILLLPVFPNTTLHLDYEEEDQRVCPEYHTSTCWPIRAPPGDRQKTKAVLVWTLHQERLFLQDCSPGHARGRSTRGSQKQSWMDNVQEWISIQITLSSTQHT